ERSPMVHELTLLFLPLFPQTRRERLVPTAWTHFTGVIAHPCTHPSPATVTGKHEEGRGFTEHRTPKTPTSRSPVYFCLALPRRSSPGHSGGECRQIRRPEDTGEQDAAFMEELVKQLTEVSVRQQQCFELLTEQHGQIQGYLVELCLPAAQNIPLPDPRVTAGRLLPKLTADDDIEAYLKMFESVARTEGWARGSWAAALAPLLSGEAQRAYFSLSASSQNNYNELKREILGRLGLSATTAAQRFHDWEYKARLPVRAQAADLMRLAEHWLLEESPSPAQVAERVVVDRMLRALPRSMRQAAGMRGPKSIAELIEAVELADATNHRGARGADATISPEGDPGATTAGGHPTASAQTAQPPRRTHAHRPTISAGQGLDGRLAISLARPATLGPRPVSKSMVPITCVHGDTRQVHTNLLTFHRNGETWNLEVGILRDLPFLLLLGREAALAVATQPLQPHRRPRRLPPPLVILTFFMMYSSRSLEGETSEKPKKRMNDSSIAGDKKSSQRPTLSLTSSYKTRRGEVKHLLVVPKNKTETVLELAHSHPMAGHLGAQNTAQRVRDRFHWPGLEAEVKRFCQACPMCQRTSPRKPPPSPLIPLPIIGVPFERIGMDIVGPLPRSGRGHEHILVILDYATRYPEAVPLRQATAKAIARELFLLFTRVGLPSEILTDQGTPFMSRLMADLCRLLKVKQVRTSVYHPQTDGLVERFNQTLKQMLRRVAAEDKKDWDLLLPYVLFGIREVPQASTGFTPFELLFGRQPRGLLDVAREAWEQQPAVYRTVVEHVRDMRSKIDRVMPLVREHLVKSQQAQQRLYNRAAQPREFQPGDRVMVLVPNAACKFLAQWQGPYTIEERVGPVNYRVRQPGRRQAVQLYHVNLLKKWVGDRDQMVALTLQEPAVVDTNPNLSAAQKAELRHLVGQFLDIFSDTPGQTNVLSHDIHTPPGVIIRQRPYRVPEARRQAIEEEIQKMLKLGVIEPSRSPWSSPIVLVPKPDGTLRFCNGYRRLNEVSDFDSYPMPRVDELLERLGRARYITTLDLTKEYWQVPLTAEAKPKTAFSTPSGHWQYRTLPFGLHGAPATFQRLMDVILRPHQSYAAACLDDVVIHSEAWEDHLERLRRVLSELRRAGLTANPRKCHLAMNEAKYLGFTVGRGLVKPQENKVRAILDAPKPCNKTQVRAFLGLAGYYRCFIPSFSSIAAPLTDLTRKGQPERVRWTEEAERAFQRIKQALTTEPVLRAPDFNCPFLLQTERLVPTAWTHFTGVIAHPCTHPSPATVTGKHEEGRGFTEHRTPKTPTSRSP
ncbi:hypothetical protein M9458_040012, partial [Cirrhinus mrigala]